MTMQQVLSMTLIGLAIGVPAAWASAPVVESFLFGIKAKDSSGRLSRAGHPADGGLGGRIYKPAWRASRIDPGRRSATSSVRRSETGRVVVLIFPCNLFCIRQ